MNMIAGERLEKFGIKPQGAAVLQHDERNQLETEQFFEQAAATLNDIEGIVRDDVIAHLAEQYGRWHPSGFMVYPLGSHDTLGGLRLHVWPKGFRQREVKGLGSLDDSCGLYDGDIHNHAWHIASLVLNGEYSDNFYDVEALSTKNGSLTDEEVALRGLWHVFQVKYRTPTQPEALRATGRYVTADVAESRAIEAGGMHFIEAGPFHAPTIPEDRLSATLVFNSARVNPGGPDILVSGSSTPIIGDRVDVSLDEAHEVRNQLH